MKKEMAAPPPVDGGDTPTSSPSPLQNKETSSAQEPTSRKRKREEQKTPTQRLTESEQIVYDIIRCKLDKGIWQRDFNREADLSQYAMRTALESLIGRKLIKKIVNVQHKASKHYMAVEFEPSEEISGGVWYDGGELDTEMINNLKAFCIFHIEKDNVATLEGITHSINTCGVFRVQLLKQHTAQILKSMVFDDEIMETKSNGMGDFAAIPVSKVCYKCMPKGFRGHKKELKLGAMASIPCGVCPRISLYSSGTSINPRTCVYLNKWLDF